jgi:hypothetical protein
MPYPGFVCQRSWNSSERRSDEYKANIFVACRIIFLWIELSISEKRVSGAVFPVSRYLAGRTGGCIQLFVGNLVKGPGGEDKVGCTVRNQPVTIVRSDPIFWLLLAPSTDLLVRFFGNKFLARIGVTSQCSVISFPDTQALIWSSPLLFWIQLNLT